MGDYLAVVLDNKVMEVAVIKSEIGDSGVIEGRFTDQQAKDLALILNSGALAGRASSISKSGRWARRWARTRSDRACARR